MKIDSLKYNGKSVKKIYQGTELVKKMNYGQSSDVFQYIKNDGDTPTPPAPVPYDEQYFTIEALTAGDLSLANADSNVFNYSLDNGSTWNNLATGQTISVEANKKVLFKAQGLTVSSNDGIGTINYTGNFNVYGNAMSLVFGDNFIGQEVMSDYQFRNLFNGNSTLLSAENLILPVTTLVNSCYQFMFNGCTSLTVAPELPATTLAYRCYYFMFNGCTSLTVAPELPATTLAYRCYYFMFQNCTTLTTAPELPATTLASQCYYSMFRGCTSLTVTPVLSATTLADGCYMSMFSDCTSLTVAPELPATTLADSCYSYMFQGCANLNSITCLATNISARQCTRYWVDGVAANGTFTKAASMTSWPTGVSSIPARWTVVNA